MRSSTGRVGRAVRMVALVVVLLAVGSVLAAPAVADQASSVTVDDVTVLEGDAGTTPAVFTLTLTQPSRTRTTVSYGTSNQTARAPGDYTATSGQVVFAPGQTTRTVSVDVIGDTRYEGDETFELQVSSADTRVPNYFGTATIVDDDVRPFVSVGDASAVEGDTGTTSMVFPVDLDRPSGTDVRVRYETDPGTAGTSDYRYTRGTLTIPAGHTSGSITVPIIGDTLDEGVSEYFFVSLTAPVGALVYGENARGTIVDDDSTPLLSALDTAVVEGNSGTTAMTFTLSLNAASPNPVTAFYATGDGTATASDYTPTQGSVVFSPGQTQRTVTVSVTGDTLYEGSGEYLRLYVTSALGANVVDSYADGTIVDDDQANAPSGTVLPPASAYHLLSVSTASVTEPDTGSVNEVFTVSLRPAASGPVTVNYGTYDSTAAAPADYTTTSGVLTVPAGATSAVFQVPVRGDYVQEGDERFGVHLSSPNGAALDTADASGYILDNDVAPTVSISDTSVDEGDTGSTADAALEITLSAPSGAATSVSYTTNNSDAQAPGDYTTTTGTVTFQPGETTHTVHVPVVGDTIDESDEQFYVYLSSASNGIVSDNRGWVVILDDDRNPSLSVDDVSVYEGTGSTTVALFTVTMSAPSANTVTVNVATNNGSAVAPDDYTAVNTTVTFAPGQTTQTVPVTVQGDSLDENDEYLNLILSSPVNAYLKDYSGTCDILDDDTAPSISVGEGAVLEPDTGTVPLTFPVTLSTASLNTVTVNWNTSDGSAAAPADYQAASGTLTFAPGQTQQTISVNVVGDTLSEGYEYFSLSLSAPTMATLRDGYSYGGIYDNDVLPRLSVDTTGVVEGTSGSKAAPFTVTLQPASPNPVTVHYSTSDGSAVAGSDYTATSGTLTFAPGVTTMTAPVQITGDTTFEDDEYLVVRLDTPTNAGVLNGTGYITILNDDQNPNPGSPPPFRRPVVSVNTATVVEGSSGTTNAVFQVRITPAPTAPVTVDYETGDGGATAGQDYTPESGTLTFAAGQSAKTVSVPVTPDTVPENDEQFSLRLLDLPAGAQYGAATAAGQILDDDHTPLVSVGDTTVNEGGAGRTVDAAFTIRLLTPSPLPVQVDWATRDGSAVAPGDYRDAGGTVTFAAGQTSQAVHVTVNGDDVVEGDENFYVDLANAVGANITSSESTGVGTILDSDAFDVLGSVTTPAGVGVSGTRVTVSGNARPTQSRLSDASGSYEFDDLPDGRYTLTPAAAGKVFVPPTYTVDVRGGATTGLTFYATTAPTIGGRITDAGGSAVPGVTVTRTGNSQPTVTATTNGAGYYVFSGSPAGSYVVTPTAPHTRFTPKQKTVTQTATNAVTVNFATSSV